MEPSADLLAFIEECRDFAKKAAAKAMVLHVNLAYNLIELEGQFTVRVRFPKNETKPDVVVGEVT